jgi:splicing factor 45
LQFQPIRRPQAQAKISRPTQKKAPGASGHAFSSSSTNATVAPTASSPDKQTPLVSSTPVQQPSVQRSNFEDWIGDEDEDDDYFIDNKPRHERGGRKKKKKKGRLQENTRSWSWDDIYDPTMPNSYGDYKGSEEQVMEIRDWKARLYYHKMKEAKKAAATRSEESLPSKASSKYKCQPARAVD